MSSDLDATDAEAIRRSVAQPVAFEVVFDRHFDTIYGYVARRAGPDVANSVASDTFCVAFATRDRYDPDRGDARPWLVGIATNLLRRHWRSERRWRRARARLQSMESTAVRPAEPADDLHARVLDQRLRSAVAELADGDREVLLLFAWGQLTYKEIADSLDIPLGTVQSRLHRARRLVRGHLQRAQPDPVRPAADRS